MNFSHYIPMERPSKKSGPHSFLRTILFFAGIFLCAGTAFAQDATKQAVSVDLLVKGATIVTMDTERRVIENGFLAVRGDEIVAIGQDPAVSFAKGLTAKET